MVPLSEKKNTKKNYYPPPPITYGNVVSVENNIRVYQKGEKISTYYFHFNFKY